MPSAQSSRTVIVGASLAGLSVAKELRRSGYGGTITLLGAEPDPPYKRPPLSKQVLSTNAQLDSVPLRVGPELGLQLRTGARVVGLDLDAREVHLDGGARCPFDLLAIATGADPVRLPHDPSFEGVHVLRTLADALGVRAALDRARSVTVVGAGFIGSEVASAARKRGCEVTVVEALDVPLSDKLGPLVGAALGRLHPDHGTSLIVGRKAVAIDGTADTGQIRVHLDDGTEVGADVVVAGIGVRPAVGWLAGSGIALRDGVICDATCAVLDEAGRVIPGVAAAGDVARWPNPFFDEEMRVEHWDNAIAQGTAAGRTLLGAAQPYDPIPFFWTDQYDVKIQFVGTALPTDEMAVVEGDLRSACFTAVYGRAGTTVGAVVVGQSHRAAHYRKQIAARAPFPPPP